MMFLIAGALLLAAQSRDSLLQKIETRIAQDSGAYAGVAYIVFDRYSNQNPDYSSGNGQNANKGPAYVSTTTDGGRTR